MCICINANNICNLLLKLHVFIIILAIIVVSVKLEEKDTEVVF